MRILFAIKSMNNPGGGAERVLADVASALSVRGHEITILSYDPADGESYYPLDKNIQHISLNIGHTDRQTSFMETLVRMYHARKAIKKHKPDIVIAFMHSMFIPLGLALIGLKIPMIASEHIVPAHYATRPFQKALLYLTPFLASRITCVSEQVKKSYVSFLRKHMTVVLNPTIINHSNKADVLGKQSGRRILLSVGRLEAQKNHQVLIKAFAKIAKDVPDWDLRIAGSGSQLNSLKKLINDASLEDRIYLLGNISDIEKEYKNAQLFSLASLYESFGLSVAEALSYGLPVVGMEDCQGVNQLVHPTINGLLAKGGDNSIPDLSEKLKTLMQDDELRAKMSTASTKFLAPHNIEHVVDSWEELINQF